MPRQPGLHSEPNSKGDPRPQREIGHENPGWICISGSTVFYRGKKCLENWRRDFISGLYKVCPVTKRYWTLQLLCCFALLFPSQSYSCRTCQFASCCPFVRAFKTLNPGRNLVFNMPLTPGDASTHSRVEQHPWTRRVCGRVPEATSTFDVCSALLLLFEFLFHFHKSSWS